MHFHNSFLISPVSLISCSIIYFPILFHFFTYFMYPNNEYWNNRANNQGLEFERVVYARDFSSDESIKDNILPPDLLRLVEKKEKQILPNQDVMKISIWVLRR